MASNQLSPSRLLLLAIVSPPVVFKHAVTELPTEPTEHLPKKLHTLTPTKWSNTKVSNNLPHLHKDRQPWLTTNFLSNDKSSKEITWKPAVNLGERHSQTLCGTVNRMEQVLVALADGHPTIANSIMYSPDTSLINAVPGYASSTGITSLFLDTNVISATATLGPHLTAYLLDKAIVNGLRDFLNTNLIKGNVSNKVRFAVQAVMAAACHNPTLVTEYSVEQVAQQLGTQ
jgi:hypothetical protein